MERKYKKKSNLVNRTGYTPGYSTERNPVNFIPSENITMANTPYPLRATPLDQEGNPIGNSVVMQPGEEYRFGGASYVAETPMFGHGGEKNDWISAKISKLVHEGYPQKQAVAIAYEMYDNVHGNGGYQLPKYEDGKKDYNFGNTFAGSNFAKPKFGADPNIQSPEQFSASLNKITEVNPGEYGLGKDPNYVSPLSPESLTAGKDWAAKNPLPQGIEKPMSTNVFGAEVEDSKTKTETTGLQKPDIQGSQPFQFFNPYSGVDIPTAGVMFGQSLENKDTLGAIASGAKVALGTARNILGGMGQARRENYVKQQYAEKQAEGARQGERVGRFGGYFQDGGMQPGMEEEQGAGQEQQMMQEVAQMLQQGADPQQVIQQLVEMGIPEDQAVQMVQAIMQQMQGSTPQLKRGGMMYYEDGGEEDDEDGGEYQDGEEYGDLINKYPNRNPNISRVEDTESKTDWYEEGMDRDTYYGFKNQLEAEGYKAVPKTESESNESVKEQEAANYDKSSARDTWVAKTGMPWSEAKRLGYTSGSAKDNMKLLAELNDSRFNKKYLRKKPLSPAKKEAEDNRIYNGGVLKEVVITAPKKKAGASRFMFTSDKAYQDYLKANNIKAPAQNNGLQTPTFDFSPKQKEQPMFRQAYQDGGEQQIAQQAAQALQEGAQPEQVMQMLLKSGMTQDQAVQLVQAIMQQVQQQSGSEEGTPQMRRGGYHQEGGMQPAMEEQGGQGNEMEAIMQQVSQMLQQGADPQEVLKMLVEAGIPEDQATQMVQAVMQQMQGGQPQQSTPQMRIGGYYQEGGEEMDEQMEGEDEGAEGESPSMEQIESQVEEALKQGADPQQVLQQLVQMGIPQEQAMQMIQEILQEIEGGETESEAPEMKNGGSYLNALKGKTIKDYTYNPKTNSYTVSYE
jgi:transcriptional regulator CtsR